MARSAAIGMLIEDLIVAVSKSEKNSTTFQNAKSRFDIIIKEHSNWNHTDPFAVEKHFDGLVEKFRVLSKDDLADSLSVRLSELEGQRISWMPEILSLLQQLSDRPANISQVPRFELSKSKDPELGLTWSDLDPTGTAFADEDIWAEVYYGELSSDEEDSTASSDISIPRIFPQSAKPQQDEFEIPSELIQSGEDDELISTIKSGHFWEYDSAAVREFSESHTRYVTELQAAREIIFMLQGLPTSLFWKLDNSIAVDRRYALRHASNSAFLQILRSCADIGASLGEVRRYVKNPQSVIFLQTFVRGVETHLREFDNFLANLQLRYLSIDQAVTVSLLQLMEEVRRGGRVLSLLADLVAQLERAPSGQSFLCLDLLYDLVCTNQASGNDDEYRALAKLFFSCFEAYTQPIHLWMGSGFLEANQDTFFITDTRRDNDLRTLWHNWYSLEEIHGRLNAPKFVKPSARKILTTGKSMIFLQNLNISPEDLGFASRRPFSFDDVCPDDASLQLLPFSGLLDKAFDDLIATNHKLASEYLREQLGEQCGLWNSLSALQYIYLCQDITVSSLIDSKIFELIDKGRGVWNDRFLLTELVQSTFSGIVSVDTSRVIVRSTRGACMDSENPIRSVKMLKVLSIDYILPWPVANIITKNAISTYQRISTFLMQIRRAKYILERQRLRKEDHDSDGFNNNSGDDGRGYIIRHSLLWLTNTLYSHFTELVVAMSTENMKKALAASVDVNGMIAVHEAYMSSLEQQCLLSTNLGAIYKAVIGLLDLCVHLADIQSARHGANRFDKSNRSFHSSTGGNRQYPKRWRPPEGALTISLILITMMRKLLTTKTKIMNTMTTRTMMRGTQPVYHSLNRLTLRDSVMSRRGLSDCWLSL
ncbi:putative gamma-tubulin complex component GCP5 [Talaromyces proteolyticus]|uniref:Spindle pole body component n=1 Tax=Talaromyces proteolyticus TaxID=1131652 RepID=A0AAD4KX83_9EURO|nr:putative gamma-tubulin complex component GCP5 [Talaromyces proteolyticus]KAH8701965.1 putative gamma-tubulin complex component GCP5 [Talaromyces proteolyticus]